MPESLGPDQLEWMQTSYYLVRSLKALSLPHLELFGSQYPAWSETVLIHVRVAVVSPRLLKLPSLSPNLQKV